MNIEKFLYQRFELILSLIVFGSDYTFEFTIMEFFPSVVYFMNSTRARELANYTVISFYIFKYHRSSRNPGLLFFNREKFAFYVSTAGNWERSYDESF